MLYKTESSYKQALSYYSDNSFNEEHKDLNREFEEADALLESSKTEEKQKRTPDKTPVLFHSPPALRTRQKKKKKKDTK
jgi:hypothetical protein